VADTLVRDSTSRVAGARCAGERGTHCQASALPAWLGRIDRQLVFPAVRGRSGEPGAAVPWAPRARQL